MKYLLLLFLLILIPVEIEAFRQVAGVFSAELEPGKSQTIQWRLISDSTEPGTVYLSSTGEGKDLLSYDTSIILEPQKITDVPITITIPEDYQGNQNIKPKVRAKLATTDERGAAIISLGVKKTIHITINNIPQLHIQNLTKTVNEKIIPSDIVTNDTEAAISVSDSPTIADDIKYEKIKDEKTFDPLEFLISFFEKLFAMTK